MPSPGSLYIEQQSNVTQVFITDPAHVDLICHFNVSKAVNTPFFITATWWREDTQVFRSTKTYNPSLLDDSDTRKSMKLNSTLSFNPLESHHLRNYTCSLMIGPLRSSSTFLYTVGSNVTNSTTKIDASMFNRISE